MSREKLLTIVAWFIGLYHMLLGLLGLFGTQSLLAPIIKMVYGVSPVFDNQFLYVVKFLGAYFIAFAVCMIVLAMNPVRYRQLIWVGVVLFSIRVFSRIVFFSLLRSAFPGITWGRNLVVLIPVTILAVLLIVLRPKPNTSSA